MKSAALIVRRDGSEEQTFELVETETLIGRGPSADLQILDDSISREHVVVLWDGDDFAVEDLQSTNGVRVNGKRVRSAPLQHGDEIQIGQTRFVFVLH